MDLTGKTALVTGAASGIGRESALAFARAGADLVLCDVNEAGLAETAAAIRSLERTRRVPIIFLSAQRDRRADGRDSHSEFILKPVDGPALEREAFEAWGARSRAASELAAASGWKALQALLSAS